MIFFISLYLMDSMDFFWPGDILHVFSLTSHILNFLKRVIPIWSGRPKTKSVSRHHRQIEQSVSLCRLMPPNWAIYVAHLSSNPRLNNKLTARQHSPSPGLELQILRLDSRYSGESLICKNGVSDSHQISVKLFWSSPCVDGVKTFYNKVIQQQIQSTCNRD